MILARPSTIEEEERLARKCVGKYFKRDGISCVEIFHATGVYQRALVGIYMQMYDGAATNIVAEPEYIFCLSRIAGPYAAEITAVEFDEICNKQLTEMRR